MRERLTDQHPVKWIAMQRRQTGQVHDGSFVQTERGNQVLLALPRNE